MILVSGIRLPLAEGPGAAPGEALRRLGVPAGRCRSAELYKVSVDARRRPPSFVCTAALRLANGDEETALAARHSFVRRAAPLPAPPQPGSQPLPGRVVVCGLGPAGLFAALELAEAGYAPLVLERGPAMEARRAAVTRFAREGLLDENANVQFGEGGAGTFSDGKLTTRIGDPLCRRVLAAFEAGGVPAEVLHKAKPHIGTDVLHGVLVALRERLLALGGEVRFNTQLTGLVMRGGQLAAVETSAGEVPCGVLVLATGHSARDTYAMLAAAGMEMQAKPFSVGLRIEHLQRDIDEGLYHEAAGHPALPAGEYQLSAKLNGRGVYTFCMCPGGSVVAAASEAGGVVTNGMSNAARSGPNANAALVAEVRPEDIGSGPMASIDWQRRLERAAFAAGGEAYVAPAETVGSFLEGGGVLRPGAVEPSYPRGVRPADLGGLLGADIAGLLRFGLGRFARQLAPFARADAVLTGLETRTSAPLRLVRGEGLVSLSHPGVYPAGEGAGYAGGIMSAAVDGIRVAREVILRYNKVLV